MKLLLEILQDFLFCLWRFPNRTRKKDQDPEIEENRENVLVPSWQSTE